MNQVPRHNVFISHHDADREYKRRFIQMMGHFIVDTSVDEDDIDDTDLVAETVRREIRDGYIRQASVTIVLIGPCTWQRMHVDWEIHSSIRNTDYNRRCGLLGILLPGHPDHGPSNYHDRLIPARLADNADGTDRYAQIYDWPRKKTGRRYKVLDWIQMAYERRAETLPNSGRPLLLGNSGGRCSDGW